jgi:hypothetical protein
MPVIEASGCAETTIPCSAVILRPVITGEGVSWQPVIRSIAKKLMAILFVRIFLYILTDFKFIKIGASLKIIFGDA